MVATERIFKWMHLIDDDKLEFDMDEHGISHGKWAFTSDKKPEDGSLVLKEVMQKRFLIREQM